MKRNVTFLLLIFCLLFPSTCVFAMIIDDFSETPAGKYPANWRTWPFQGKKARQVYSIKEENGQKYLHAFDDKDLSIQILKDFDWKLDYYPNLKWKWRALQLPKDANETNPATNDSACGVYIIFSKARQEMMKFTWSTTASPGTVYEKVKDKAYIIVLDSGSKKLNQWVEHSVNVAEEYKKYFKKELDRNPVAIAVLTDGNATHSAAECDYKDFRIE